MYDVMRAESEIKIDLILTWNALWDQSSLLDVGRNRIEITYAGIPVERCNRRPLHIIIQLLGTSSQEPFFAAVPQIMQTAAYYM
jgi:hypothetical protein